MIDERLSPKVCRHEHINIEKRWMFLDAPYFVATCKDCERAATDSDEQAAKEKLRG